MGASSGIGLSVAEALLTADIKVGLAARHTEPLKKLKEKYPDKVEYERIDITDKKAPEHLDSLIRKLGGMDIYFHCSGIARSSRNLDIDSETATVETNATGFARMLAAAYRYFRDEKRPGQIAAITSVAGTRGIGDLAAYSASKCFDQAYMTALDQLARSEGVKISFTDIRPGWTDTPLINPTAKYPMLMTTSYVTSRVLRAIALKRRVEVVDWRWNIAVGLWRLLPRAIWTRMPVRFEL